MNIALPRPLLDRIDRTGRSESRTRSELVREASRMYIARKERWKAIRADRPRDMRLVLDTSAPETRPSVVTADPEDNRVLECAVEGGADVIVSGDRDLLALGRYAGIPVCRPQEFLARDR